MPGRVQDKVTLITGASMGQDEAEARRFAAEGARLVLCDLPSRAEALKKL